MRVWYDDTMYYDVEEGMDHFTLRTNTHLILAHKDEVMCMKASPQIDSNSNTIYEGDKLLFHDLFLDGEVILVEDHFIISGMRDGFEYDNLLSNLESEYCEIVGNIYE